MNISPIANSESGLSVRQKLNILVALYNSIAVSDGSFNLNRLVASWIKDASPSGKFLSDDGTWQNVSVSPTLDDVLTNGFISSKSIKLTDGSIELLLTPTGYVQVTDTSTGAYCVINPYTLSNNSNDGKYAQLDWSVGLLLKTSNVLGSKSVNIKADNISGSNKELQLPNETGTLATMSYVDAADLFLQNQVNNINAGLRWKDSVKAATTANITLSGLQTIDGYAGSSDDRILVKDQTTASENGIYLMKSGSWVRATDADTGTEILQATVGIEKGATYADQIWMCSTDAPITIGTTSIAFIKSSNTTYSAGTYLSLLGNVFNIDFSTFNTGNIIEGSKLFFTNARAIAALLTGYVKGAGTVAATDSILQAIQKLDGNLDTKVNLPTRVIFGDANYSATATDTEFVTSVTLTAQRVITLSGSVAAGKYQLIADEFGAINGSNNLVIAVQSGKKLNGVVDGTETIESQFGHRLLWSDGAGNFTFDDGVVRKTKIQTISNKRITKRITTISSSATPTINTDNCDMVDITALATAITSMTTNLTGTPNNGDKLEFRILDNGTARAITWGSSFVAKGATLPTTTVAGKHTTVGVEWFSSISKWGCIAIAQEV